MNIKVETQGLDNLKKMINYISKVKTIPNDAKFNEYIKKLVEQTYLEVMNRELVGGTTNDLDIQEYMNSWGTYDLEDGSGFVLYNNATIPADKYNILPFDTSGYPNGEFSLAMAFEYGTGIKGIGANHKDTPWYLPKNVTGESGVSFDGYQGFEIFRKTRIEVEKNLDDWVKEYFKKEGVKYE